MTNSNAPTPGQPLLTAFGKSLETTKFLIEALDRIHDDNPAAQQWLDELRSENQLMQLALLQLLANV